MTEERKYPPHRRLAETYRAAFRGLPREAWIVSTVVLINRSGSMVLPFLVLFLTRERGLSVVEAGGVLSLYGAGAIVGSYLGGALSDRVGPVRTQIVSLVGGGFGLLLLGRIEGRLALSLVALGVSVVAELFRPASLTALARTTSEEQQARAFALLRLAINLGVGLGPALGGFLARRAYWWIFVCDAATSFAAAAVLFAIHGFGEVPERRHATLAVAARPPWKDGPYLLLLVFVFLLGVVFFQLMSTFPVYLRDHFRMDEAGVGLALALNALLVVAFEMVLMHALEGRERLPLVGAGAFLVCLGFGLMPFGRSAWWVPATVVLWTTGEMISLPLLNAVVANRAGPVHRGRYLGAYTTAFSVSFAAAPTWGTWIYANLAPDLLWFLVAGLGPLLWLAFAGLAPAFRGRNQ